jgi:proteasome alpha subunit
MYEEPYRWIEAVRNRREYLEEQLSAGGPIVALPYENGALLATLGGGGTPKLYEVYDQIAFGGMGHPADLEKLRNVVLDTAHVEGFNRSPVDVTVQRLMKFGLAPMVKQAFEEILHAPYICKIVMAELSHPSGAPLFFQLNYDGVFEERAQGLVLAASPGAGQRMETFLKEFGDTASFSLKEALKAALRTWAVSQLPLAEGEEKESAPKTGQLDTLLKKTMEERTIEAALLDRTQPGSSKYRTLSKEELQTLTHGWLK